MSHSNNKVKITLTRADYLFALVVVLCLCSGYLTSDIYLPALPQIRNYFGINISISQHTLSIYFFGFALSQFLAGPMIDRFNTRKVAMYASVGLLLASMSCALSTTYTIFFISRFLQSLFTGILTIIGRASFAKTYKSEKATYMFLKFAPFAALSPAIAPVIGGCLAHYYNWQSPFLFLACLSFFIFAGLTVFYPTTDKSNQINICGFTQIFKPYLYLLSNRQLMLHVILLSLAFASYFSYITEAPFIFSYFCFTPLEIGLTFMPLALSFFVASQIARHLLNKTGKNKIIHLGLCFQITGFLLFIPIQLFFYSSIYIVVSASLMAFGFGFVMPVTFSSGIATINKHIGSASSLLTSLPFAISAIATALVHYFCNNHIIELSIFCLILLMPTLLLRFKA